MKFLVTLVLSLHMSLSYAQKPDNHQWNDRLILILIRDLQEPLLADQLQKLRNHQAGLQDRKLVVYIATPGKYRTELESNSDWVQGDLFQKYHQGEDFEVILIGLDGGVKLRQSELLTAEKLFATIDQMPMRQAEIGRNAEK